MSDNKYLHRYKGTSADVVTWDSLTEKHINVNSNGEGRDC